MIRFWPGLAAVLLLATLIFTLYSLTGAALGLRDLQRRVVPCACSTAGWVMPAFPPELDWRVRVMARPELQAEMRRRGLVGAAFTAVEDGVVIVYVPPLNTVVDMELWRHELRHAIERHWH